MKLWQGDKSHRCFSSGERKRKMKITRAKGEKVRRESKTDNKGEEGDARGPEAGLSPHFSLSASRASKIIFSSGKNFCWWHSCGNENATVPGWCYRHWLLMGKIPLHAQFSGLSVSFIPTLLPLLSLDITPTCSSSSPCAVSSTGICKHGRVFRSSSWHSRSVNLSLYLSSSLPSLSRRGFQVPRVTLSGSCQWSS